MGVPLHRLLARWPPGWCLLDAVNASRWGAGAVVAAAGATPGAPPSPLLPLSGPKNPGGVAAARWAWAARGYAASSSSSGTDATPPSSSGRGGSSGGGKATAAAGPAAGFVGGKYRVEDFPPERIRNFSIVAHIDHGKSTLSDRLMQATGAVAAGARAQYLDRLQVERERGITVKAQSVSLVYRYPADGQPYLLNLIDTPGHVDFSYEVSRSLAACQGALLLVDAVQGVQAQTVANFYLAFEQGLELLPVLNKTDLPAADPARVAAQLASAFDLDAAAAVAVSAKTGAGVDALLPAIVERIPPPPGDPSRPLRALLFDAYHDEYRGVITLVAVVDGSLSAGDRLVSAATGREYDANEVGVLAPEPHPTGSLLTGQVGYVITGIKDVKAARVGDTWHSRGRSVEPLPGFKPARPMVFAGLYPASADEYESLAAAIERLTLNDASVGVKKESSDALGAGFRCGFLGPLHCEVFLQRLEQEHGAAVVSTPPMVPYELEVAGAGAQGGGRLRLESAAAYPRDARVLAIYEPTVTATIVVPPDLTGPVMALCLGRRGEQLEHGYLGAGGGSTGGGGGLLTGGGGSGGGGSSSGGGVNNQSGGQSGGGGGQSGQSGGGNSGQSGGQSQGGVGSAGDRVVLRYRLPLAELAGDFYSKLKTATHGFASFDYEEGPLRAAPLVLLELLVNGRPVDALSRLVAASDARRAGRVLTERLKGLLDRQQFEVVIQAAADGRVVARETIKAARKDVLAKCYGGDVSRKRKLLEKQKEGKKRLRQLGALTVPAEAFPELMRSL